MATTDGTAATAQARLEELRLEFKKLVHQETTVRGARDTAVHAAKNQNIPISHLANEAGVSRELLHRIIRTQLRTHPTPATSKTAAIQQLKTNQAELAKILTRKSSLQKKRAQLIRETIQASDLPKSAIARAAGISTETIRKTCQPK